MNKDFELEGLQLYWGRQFSKTEIFFRSLAYFVRTIVRLVLLVVALLGLLSLLNHLWLVQQSGLPFLDPLAWQGRYLTYFFWSAVGGLYLFYSFSLLVLLFIVPLIAVAGAGWWWLSGGRYVSTDNAYVKAHIVQIAPEVSGQIRRVLTRDHASVAAGAQLFTIESRPFRLALDSAEAELDSARAHVENLRGIWREAVAELADAEARADYFQRQAQRQEELAAKGVASASKRDESQNDARAAADRVATAREKLRRVLAALNGDPQLAVEAHPLVREKTAARERAALDLARTTVRAPVDGVVVNMRLQQGEQVKASTPLFSL